MTNSFRLLLPIGVIHRKHMNNQNLKTQKSMLTLVKLGILKKGNLKSRKREKMHSNT